MDTAIQSCLDELEKIAAAAVNRSGGERKWRRNVAVAAGSAGALAAAGLGGRVALRTARKAYSRGLDNASDVFAKKLEAGVRRGVQEGFDEGVATLRKEVPGMTDEMMRNARPHLDQVTESLVQRAREEAPGLGEAVADGFKSSVKKNMPKLWRRS
jgi:hypothetical protein